MKKDGKPRQYDGEECVLTNRRVERERGELDGVSNYFCVERSKSHLGFKIEMKWFGTLPKAVLCGKKEREGVCVRYIATCVHIYSNFPLP